MYYTDSVSQWVSQVWVCFKLFIIPVVLITTNKQKVSERFLLIKTLLYGHSHYTKSWSFRRLNDIKVWVVFYRKLCFFTATVKKNRNLELTTKSIKVLISEVGSDMWIHWLITVSADWTKNIQPNAGNLISVCLKIRITVINVVASPRAHCLWTLTFTLEADGTLVGLQFLTELNWTAWNAD